MIDSDALLRGDRRALAQALSVVETGGEESVALLDAVWTATGNARRIGITGPPGAGKSTLVAGLVKLFRADGQEVGVILVDPTSPFTGGALLGDRHRMSREASDDGVFVRSLASRGSPGGLARAAPAALDLLDAAGFSMLVVETVGVGQTEVEVAATADTVVVVLSPESGDAVQAMKAGLLEIADVYCINKADRDGAAALVLSLQSMLDHREADGWRPPVVSTNALEGADALRAALADHGAWLAGGDRLRERRRAGLCARLRHLVSELVAERLLASATETLQAELDDVAAGHRSILHAARRVVDRICP